jgi:hypothetical protein
MSTLTQITSAEYANLNAKIGAMLSSNRKPSISIYMDEAGTIPAKDAAGNDIVDLQIVSVSITQSYLDSVTNEPVNASLTLSFSDHSFKVVDNTETYYYSVGGTDFPLRTI